MEVSCVLKYGNWGEYPLRFARPPCRGTVFQRSFFVGTHRNASVYNCFRFCFCGRIAMRPYIHPLCFPDAARNVPTIMVLRS